MMRKRERDRVLIRQFLLGKLVEEDQLRVEQRFLTNPEYRDEVLMVEDELLEDFIAGTLSEPEHAKFTTYYLSGPRQIQKLKVARALSKYAAANPPIPSGLEVRGRRTVFDFLRSRNRLLQFAFVGLIVIGLAGGWWLFSSWRQRVRETELIAELQRLNSPQAILKPSGNVLAVSLSLLRVRQQGQLATVTLTPATNIVQLLIPGTTGAYESYRVRLQKVVGEQVVEFDAPTQQQGGVLILQLPTRVLTPDDYVINLRGVKAGGLPEDVGDYYFRVQRGQP